MKNVLKNIDWAKGGGLVPAIIQDSVSMKNLMLGYMNMEALNKTFETGNVWFFSRSKGRLWMKGETSGNVLKFVGARVDCDGDAFLISVIPSGPVCHKGEVSCFGDVSCADVSGDCSGNPIAELFQTIADRRLKMPEDSYTSKLFAKGVDKICAKIGEESGEVIKAAQKETQKRLIEESVDLFYHMLVLLVYKDVKLSQFFAEISRRRK